MQFQVPQFIETEDKIIGPLTIKQFIYVAIPAAIGFLLFTRLNLVLWILITVPLLAVGIALAFLKINGQPLMTIVRSAMQFYWQPQTYVWQPGRPSLPKNEASLREAAGGLSLESIISGMALKNAWRYMQTGSKAEDKQTFSTEKPGKERYQIFRSIKGERRAAKRVDYR